jgi:hypothetical protein
MQVARAAAVYCYRNRSLSGGWLIQRGATVEGSDANAWAGWFCPEYSRFRPSPQQLLVPVRNERLVTPENGMPASALDNSFLIADIENVFGHLFQNIGLVVIFIHHFSFG